MQPTISKRLLAFIVDIIIVFSLSTIITGLIPVSEKVNKQYERLEDLTNNITEKYVDYEDYLAEVNSITYEINHETVIDGIITIVIYLLYFTVYPMYNNGQTLGKKAFKLKVVNNDDTPVDINKLVIRALFLYNLLIKIVLLVLIVFLSKDLYIKVNNYIEYIQVAFFFATTITLVLRKDKRGLHDLIAKTKVIEE